MRIVVIGLGYVGLPLAVQLAKFFHTVGLDVSKERIAELREGHDRTHELSAEALSASTLELVDDPDAVAPANMYIVTVPTPIDAENRPDLGAVRAATRTVAGMINPALRPAIVYESTVYPGVTEEVCGPILEAAGHVRGRDFSLGYSPERINPGDREHTVDRIVKVIAGEDEATTDLLAHVYGAVTTAGVFRAASIRAAEAAKVIENAQRDINIAFMNEISQIFARLELSTWDVLAAARTKWNFLPFSPGLVGGHCIGVDPYYLSWRAQQLGHEAQVILSGRTTNDGMGEWIADEIHAACGGHPGSILMLGLTFKEDVPDLRNSKVIDVIRRLEALGHSVTTHDPLARDDEALHEYDIRLDPGAMAGRYDVVVGAVAHQAYRQLSRDELSRIVRPEGLVADLKGMWRETQPPQARYWTL